MKIAIVHDDLVQFGGAERVLEGLCEIFPNAPVYTSVFDFTNKELNKRFGKKRIITSFLQKIPGWKVLYKTLLPLYPVAFEQFNFDEYDAVLSHTTRFAKAIITKPKTKHISYCHTPPRFLWHFSENKSYNFLEFFLSGMRIYDRISSSRVDIYLGGSENAKARIKKIYGRECFVVYPFIDLERYNSIETFNGGYFVVVARLNKYKRVDLAIEACERLAIPLKIIGAGSEFSNLRNMAGSNIQFLGNISDELKEQVLAGARGLIIPGIEDFGITSIEAQALGKGVIAYQVGGSQETVIDGKTGLLFKNQTMDCLVEAIQKYEKIKLNSDDCRRNASRFSKEIFKSNFHKYLPN